MFCTDLTVDKNNQEINGGEFVSSVVDPEKRERLDELADELESAIQRAKTPSSLVMVRSIAGFGALVIAMNLFNIIMESGISAIFASDKVGTTLIFFAAAAIWFYLGRRDKALQKQVAESPEIKEKSRALECEMIMLQNAMGVPTSAKHTDVIVYPYTVVDGVIKPHKQKLMPPSIFLIDVMTYEDGDGISICDTEKIYTVKKSDIKGIRKIEEQIAVHLWNKDEEPTAGRFAEYGMSYTKGGLVSMPYYYAVEISGAHEDFELYFPCYELPTFAAILAPEMLAESYVDDEDDVVDEAVLDEINDAAEEENEACDDLAEGDITALAEEAESEEKPVEDVEEMVENDDIDNTDSTEDDNTDSDEEDTENLE
jgi:hypothetical protein